MSVAFNKQTDRATLERSHRCVDLLIFSSAAMALCVWKEHSVLRVYPTGYDFSTATSLIDIGDKIFVKDGILRAKCPALATFEECLMWRTSSSVQCVVTPPHSPVFPEVFISVPRVVSPCTNFILDLTASSGSGGRPWNEVTINVSSISTSNRSLMSASRMSAFYHDDYALFPPTPLAADYMVENTSYAFTVRLCNYLQRCNSSSVTIEVKNMNVIPIAIIGGSQSRRIKRSQTLIISADAHVAYCNSSNRYSDMILHWKVSENGVRMENLLSTSKDPYKFILPSFVLNAGHSYTVTIFAIDQRFGGQSSASVIVDVVPSDVVAIISGGASRVWRFHDGNITIDASNSYDPDAVGEDSSLLEYIWSCSQSQWWMTMTHSFCSELLPVTSRLTSSPRLSLDMSVANFSRFVGASFTILLEVMGLWNRTDIASVSYTITHSNSPRITFIPDPPKRIYTHRRLELMAVVETNAESTADWSVNDRNFDLSLITLTSTFAEFAMPGSYMFNMVIREFELLAGSLYDFSLSVRSARGEEHDATLTLTVGMLEVPRPGEFIVSPSQGTEIQDYFSFVTSLWTNDELPLTHAFGYYAGVEDDHADFIALNRRSGSAFSSDHLLPGGQEANNYSLSCGVYVFNNLDARNYLVRSVQVFKSHMPVEDLAAAIMAQLSDASWSQDMDKLKSDISVGISVLNSANCSLAPISCKNLGRHECGQTSHSCGACLPEFVGQDGGDGNSPCYNVSDDSFLSSTSSNSSCDNSDCPNMHMCIHGRCEFSSKWCPSSCSNRGKCRFELISTGVKLQECHINDFTCIAKCECDDGYSGEGCTQTQNSMTLRQDTRLQLLLFLNSTLQYEDADLYSVTSFVRRVIDAGSVSTELEESSCSVLQSVISSVLTLAAMVTEPSTIAVDGLFKVLDNCVDVYARLSYSSGVHGASRKMSKEQLTALENNHKLRDSLSIFSIESMVAGERTKNFIQSNSRLSMTKNAANAATEQYVPRTQMESLFAYPMSMILLEDIGSDDKTLTRSVILAESKIFNSSLSSSSISVRQLYKSANLSSPSVPSNSHVVITIQTRTSQTYVTLNELRNATLFVTRCSLSNRSQSVNYTCPNGDMVSHVCDAANEVITSICPSQLYLPTCVVLSSSASKSSCDLVSFTPTNVTCNCTVTLHQASTEGKVDVGRLFRSRSAQSLGYIEIASMSQYSFEGVIKTNRDVIELSARDIVNGLTIIVMFSIFWGCGVLGLFELIRNSWFSCHREVKPRERKRKIIASDGVSLEAKKEYLLRYVIAASQSRLDVLTVYHRYIDAILPAIFRGSAEEDSSLRSMWKTVLHYHPYIVVFTSKGPGAREIKLRRGIYLLTIQSMLMFIMVRFHQP